MKIYHEKFLAPAPSDLKKLQFPPSLFAMKVTGQSHRKACKLNFYWKIFGDFFQGPSYKSQEF